MTPSAFDVAVPRLESRKLERGEIRLDGFAVALLASGSAQLALADGERAQLTEGDVVVVPPGAHCELGGARSRGELVVLELPEAWLRDAFVLCGADPGGDGRGGIRLREVAIERADSERARRALRLLRELGSSPALFGVATPLRVVSRILELVDVAGDVDPGVLKPRRARRVSAGRGRLLDALAHLRAEPLEGLSLPFLAQRLGVSERQASRLFQGEIGTTFRAWSGDVRLERACALLRETELSIVAVAAETGWSSLAHFNTAFRRREGCTPSAYRARRRGADRP